MTQCTNIPIQMLKMFTFMFIFCFTQHIIQIKYICYKKEHLLTFLKRYHTYTFQVKKNTFNLK